MFYLDHNSTTPPSPSVREAVLPYLDPVVVDTVAGSSSSFHTVRDLPAFGNPSSRTPLGEKARDAVERARLEISNFMGASPTEVVFTGGGTESCFIGLVGSVLSYSHKRHIIISAVEHPAVLETARFLERAFGIRTTLLPVDEDGQLDPNRLFDALEVDTALVSLMYANNETGVVFPIRELVQIAAARGVVTHTDATQAVGRIPVSFHDLGVDLLTFSGHKLGGLKGSGGLIVREGARWEPVVCGGGQEGGRRGGTESVPLIVALGAAVQGRAKDLADGAFERLGLVRDRFESMVMERIGQLNINAKRADRIPSTSSISFEGLMSHELVPRLAERGIYVSTGAACKSAVLEPSHVLRAMNRSVTSCLGAIRFSFGLELLGGSFSRGDSAAADSAIDSIVTILAEEVERLRAQSRQKMEQLLRRD